MLLKKVKNKDYGAQNMKNPLGSKFADKLRKWQPKHYHQKQAVEDYYAEKALLKQQADRRSLQSADVVKRFTMHDLKQLEKRPPLWKTFKVDYMNKFAFAWARYKHGSHTFKLSVRWMLAALTLRLVL